MVFNIFRLQYEYTLYHIDAYMNFYFIPTDLTSSLNLYLYSYYGFTNFTMKAFENTNHLPISELPFPNDKFGILESDHKSKSN